MKRKLGRVWVQNPPKYIIQIPVRQIALWIAWGELVSQLGAVGQDPEDVLRRLMEMAADGEASAAGKILQDMRRAASQARQAAVRNVRGTVQT